MIATVVALSDLAYGADTAAPRAWPPVRMDGLGPLRVGMTLREAELALQIELERDLVLEADYGCTHAWPRLGHDGVSFMIVDGIVARVDIARPGVTTAEGIGVGSSEQQIKAAYGGRVTVEKHHYTGPAGHYLIVPSDDGTSALLFETDGERVEIWRAGRRPEVDYVEGCL